MMQIWTMGVFFRLSRRRSFLRLFSLIYIPFKINGKIVFHSFKANKSTEREKLTHWGHRVHEKHARGFSSIFTAKVSLALRAPNPQIKFYEEIKEPKENFRETNFRRNKSVPRFDPMKL